MAETSSPEYRSLTPSEGQLDIWPNFYIVGAAKCGTGTLYEQLKKHPQVFFPAMKEPHYFATQPAGARSAPNLRCCGDRVRYQSLYAAAHGATAIGDASVSYLWDEGAPQRIYDVCPTAKIVILLRDPVIRAHSHYLNSRRDHIEPESSFGKALRLELAQQDTDWFTSRLYITAGLYYDQVSRYLRIFGKDQVLILLFDDLQRDPEKLFLKAAHHIGINPEMLDAGAELSRAYNIYCVPRFRAVRLARRAGLRAAVLPVSLQKRLRPLLFNTKKPDLDSESRQFLQQIFDPDLTRLEELLGMKIPELRKSWV